MDSQLDLALLLSVEAYHVKPTVQAMDALLGALQKSPQLMRYLHNYEGSISGIGFSPDGKTLASAGGYDRTIRLWNFSLESWMKRACAISTGT
jgi:WD40 repeat protein